MSESTTKIVDVLWRYTPAGPDRVNAVTLTEGYSTENDIPKILAIRHLRSVQDAKDVHVVSVSQR